MSKKKWNIDQVPSQKGKIAIVTGANSGIGFETALELAKKDCTVILACRNMEKAAEAGKIILKTYPDAQVKPMKLDVASLLDVRKFTQQFKSEFDKLDFLINNAGVMMSPYKETEDGFENQLATNYIGHFALTGLLLPLLTETSGSRIISLSSLAHKWAEIDFNNLHAQKGYSKRKAYGQSKRACLVFAYELQRRLSAAGYDTISLAAHPGVSKTNLDRYFPSFIRPLGGLLFQKADKGALPTLYAALEPGLKGGEYIGPDGFKEMGGNPTIVDSDEKTKDKKVAMRLWNVSEELTGVRYLETQY